MKSYVWKEENTKGGKQKAWTYLEFHKFTVTKLLINQNTPIVLKFDIALCTYIALYLF